MKESDRNFAEKVSRSISRYEAETEPSSTKECSSVQTFNSTHQGRKFNVALAGIIAGTSHKLRSFWVGPYRVSRIIAPSLAEIKHMYYPEKEKIVSLDILKLYRGGGRGGVHIIQRFEEDN